MLCTRRGGGRIGSATIGTQESVVQQVPVVDEGENVMGDNVAQSVVQQVPVVEEGVVQEVPVIHIQDGHMMQEGENSQASVMEGSDTFGQVGSSIGRKLKSINDEIEQATLDLDVGLPALFSLSSVFIVEMAIAGEDGWFSGVSSLSWSSFVGDGVSCSNEEDVNDFIDGHHFDDDVGLDGGAEGVGDEVVGDGGLDDDVGLDVGPDHGAGYEVVGDGDEEGPGGGDVDDGDGPEGDGDEEGHGGGDVDDGHPQNFLLGFSGVHETNTWHKSSHQHFTSIFFLNRECECELDFAEDVGILRGRIFCVGYCGARGCKKQGGREGLCGERVGAHIV
ncbi:unnamed protein product [Lactuca saligna]|uniref:Uncharacterized protein n=1 Tax=Lactuca saligna TaxID=75948 RepID=A0AA35Y743_LACSI|nr:unnamed protein product [Lactuca saligna]